MPDPSQPSGMQARLAHAWTDARDLLGQHRRRLTVGLILMLVNRAAALALPTSTKILLDTVVGEQRTDVLVPLAAAVAAAAVLQAVTTFGLGIVLGVAAQRAINDVRKQLQDHVTHLPVSFFDRSQSGALVSRIVSDPEGLRNLLGSGFVRVVGGALTAVLGLAVLLWLHWRLTLVVLGILLVGLVALWIAFRRLRPIFHRRGELLAHLSGGLSQSLAGARIVKAYVAEQQEHRRFAERVERLYDNSRRSITRVAAIASCSLLVVGGIGALVILLGGRALVEGHMSTGDLVMYMAYLGLVLVPALDLALLAPQIGEAFSGLDRIRELRALTSERESDGEREPRPDLKGHLRVEDLGFEYEPGLPVLRGITFDAPAGSTTAIVGPSGSGKSTLLGLLMAFYRPSAGRILVDGEDLADLRRGSYRKHLGVVLQECFLFDGSVSDNIRFARPGASEAEVRAAARVAYCEAFAADLPEGFDTLVGERGVRLSAGQRQRIAIARAVLAAPRILILDEATSSLDSASEAWVQRGLDALARGCTTFVVAHRLSSIHRADQILVLEQGRIVERGTHSELIAADGAFRKLYDQQRLEYEAGGADPDPSASAPSPHLEVRHE